LDAQLSYLKIREPLTLRSQSQVLAAGVQGYQRSSQADPLFPEHLFSIDQATHGPIVVVHMCVPQAMAQQKAEPVSDHLVFPSPEPTLLLDPLSPRERDVLHCLASGLSNREIAQRLVIAISTVKWHLKQIYGKLGASSRTQAIAHARERKLIP
jgi:DNA-binding NarL/FixJ family response regulator